MNVYWKTIITGVVTIAAIVSARSSAQWVHHNVIRSPSAQASAQAKPAYVPYVPAASTAVARPATSTVAARPPKPYKPNAFPPRS